MGDVDGLQGSAVIHLLRQGRDAVVGKIQILDEVEADGKLWRDLRDDIAREVATVESDAPHKMVHGVGNLHQLTIRQI